MDNGEPLPEGWSKHYSNTWKKPYYFNKKTGKQVWEHPGKEGGDSPAGSVAGDSARKRSASVEADMGGGNGDTDGGLVKKAKTKASVDFSAVKEASAAKKAANMPPVDKIEDTPEIAVARDREVKKLIEHIRLTCARSVSLSKEPGNALTRFFFLSQIDSRKQGEIAPENDGKAENGGKDLAIHDVLIPFNAGKDTCLHRELLKAGLEPGEADERCMAVSSAASQAVQVVCEVRAETKRGVVSFVDEVMHKEAPNRQMLVCWKDQVMTINREHFLKVEKLYEKHTGMQDPQKTLFLLRLFSMLMRYQSLGGVGYQTAVPAAVFAMLKQEFQVSHECFASPFNCSLDSFGSAFYDTDKFFGSKGSFFSTVDPATGMAWTGPQAASTSHIFLLLQGGSFQAKPPFVEESMQLMSETIDAVLSYTQDQDPPRATSFIVIVPSWSDERSHEMMRESCFCKKHVVLEKSQHSYRGGAQHTSLQQYHESGFKTSVFFLQNRKGSEKWPVTEAGVLKLQDAFKKWE